MQFSKLLISPSRSGFTHAPVDLRFDGSNTLRFDGENSKHKKTRTGTLITVGNSQGISTRADTYTDPAARTEARRRSSEDHAAVYKGLGSQHHALLTRSRHTGRALARSSAARRRGQHHLVSRSMQCLFKLNLHLFQSARSAALRATSHGIRRGDSWTTWTQPAATLAGASGQGRVTSQGPAWAPSSVRAADSGVGMSIICGRAGSTSAPMAVIERAYDDTSPYVHLAKDVNVETSPNLQSFWEREWLEPESTLSLGHVQYLCIGKYRTEWKGAALMKDPVSLIQYQKLLAKLRPRTIFDLGTCGGGSAIWLADQCRSLGLDTTVVTIDIEDLRPQHVKDHMDQDERIMFLEGNAFDVAGLVKRARENGLELEHPWLVSEDCHLDAYPLVTAFRSAGMKAGDYWVFEDTHPLNPDEAGMSSLDLDAYRTGNFARGKYRQLQWAMTAFPDEYAVDVDVQDMFGVNGSLFVNSVLRQVDPEPTTALHSIEYSLNSLDSCTSQIADALQDHGHCLLRYTGDADVGPGMPDPLVDQLARACGVEAVDYAKAGGSDKRSFLPVGGIEVTNFPAGSHIPPHHELLCTRLYFVTVIDLVEELKQHFCDILLFRYSELTRHHRLRVPREGRVRRGDFNLRRCQGNAHSPRVELSQTSKSSQACLE